LARVRFTMSDSSLESRRRYMPDHLASGTMPLGNGRRVLSVSEIAGLCFRRPAGPETLTAATVAVSVAVRDALAPTERCELSLQRLLQKRAVDRRGLNGRSQCRQLAWIMRSVSPKKFPEKNLESGIRGGPPIGEKPGCTHRDLATVSSRGG
jgi:hypothetical protein